MRRLSWLALLLLSCQALPLLADRELLASVSDRLVTGHDLQGRFEQEKSIPFLTQPLLSSGDFNLSNDSGLRWRVSSPVVSEMTVDTSGVTLDGRAVKDRGAGELIAELMLAFMTGDLSGPERMFTITGESYSESWHLTLIPRSALLKSALERIDVRGGSFLQQVVIVESSASVTRIRLFEVIPDSVSVPWPDAD